MIKAAFFDIDGVLTDGNVYVDSASKETKRISFEDIDAVFELKRAGIKIGFITGEDNEFSEFVRKRFSPDYFVSGCKEKLEYFMELAGREGLRESEVCYAGDSKKDIPLLVHLKYSFAPSDVRDEVKTAAKYVTKALKGLGVVREVADFISSVNGKTEANSFWKERISGHVRVAQSMINDDALLSVIEKTARQIADSFKSGGKLLFCGNGGSAANSQHLATELVNRFLMERKALDAEALAINTSSLTAIGNDYNFDVVFSRQVEAKGKPGDILIGISTSGNSKNVVKAVQTAKKIGMKTVALTGGNKSAALNSEADCCIAVPSTSTPRIQEMHILIGHMICEGVEKELFNE